MQLYDVLHKLVDRAGFHNEQEVRDAHDTISGHAEGFKTLEEYRDAQAPAPSADDEAAAQARLDDIQRRRSAQQQTAQEQQAAIPQPVAERPAAPAIAPEPTVAESAPVTQPAGVEPTVPQARPTPAPGL